jgi:N4-gp56 family major capsid protein
MSATFSTTTSLNDLLPSIVAEALFVASERSIMRGLVKNYTLSQGSGKTVTVPVYPLQSATALTEGTDLLSSAVSTNGAILTVAEVGLMTSVTDLAQRTSASDVIADVGRLFGEAIARKIDQDLTAKFVQFTTNVVGSANIAAISATLSAADVFKAVAALRSAGVPGSDLACVLHPSVAYDLKATLTNTFANPNAGMLQNEAMMSGYVGMLAGVPVFETSNIVNNGTAGDFVGGLFHRDALGLAVLQDINIETQRDASLRATELVATATYATGTVYEGYGVAMSFDSSIL